MQEKKNNLNDFSSILSIKCSRITLGSANEKPDESSIHNVNPIVRVPHCWRRGARAGANRCKLPQNTPNNVIQTGYERFCI